MIIRAAVGFVVVLLWTATHLAQTPSQRLPRVDDGSAAEAFNSFTFAPDGLALAFVRSRPANSQVTNGLQLARVRDDVWVQEGPGRPVRNLTQGAQDASGWWAPTWAPDGRHLAFLSSRGGSVALWVWERGTSKIRQLSSDGIAFDEKPSYLWIDAQHLVAAAVPEGERSAPVGGGGYTVGKGVELATAAWGKAARGEVTANVSDTRQFSMPSGRLLLYDVTSKAERPPRKLADLQLDSTSFWSSPASQVIAYRRRGVPSIALSPSSTMGFLGTLDLVRLDGQPLPLDARLPTNIVTSSLKFSPDGRELAFFALGPAAIHPDLLYDEGGPDVQSPPVATKEYPGRLWRVDLIGGKVAQVGTGDVDLGQRAAPPEFQWTGAGALLFRAPRLISGARPIAPTTSEWLVLSRDGRTRPLAAPSVALPDSLRSINGGAGLLGIADGDLWLVDTAKGTTKNLTERIGPVVYFDPVLDGPSVRQVLVIATTRPPQTNAERWAARLLSRGYFFYALGTAHILDVVTGDSVELTAPVAEARPVAISGVSRSVVYTASTRDGTFAWRGGADSATRELGVANAHLRRIAVAEQRILEYTGLNGRKLKAKVTLPFDYKPGRRYPLVVSSDTGMGPWPEMVRNDPIYYEPGTPQWAVVDESALFAAAGYMYMWASMPTDDMDAVGRGNLLSFTDGILPAVDKAVEAGLADPDRLLLTGGSSMGEAVLGIITQTARFRAAVAGYCWADQITNSLDVGFVQRYSSSAFFKSAGMGSAYLDNNLPFWRNGDQYRRNSPLYYVDRVRTPVLLVAGEMDVIPTTSLHMFFVALVQQQKPAQFVRYWAEGHGVATPANMRDYWRRVFAWFDEHGDIARAPDGTIVFDAERPRSRAGKPSLAPEDFARFGPAIEPAKAGTEQEPQP